MSRRAEVVHRLEDDWEWPEPGQQTRQCMTICCGVEAWSLIRIGSGHVGVWSDEDVTCTGTAEAALQPDLRGLAVIETVICHRVKCDGCDLMKDYAGEGEQLFYSHEEVKTTLSVDDWGLDAETGRVLCPRCVCDRDGHPMVKYGHCVVCCREADELDGNDRRKTP